MNKYTIYRTDEFGEQYDIETLHMTRNERKYADTMAGIRCDGSRRVNWQRKPTAPPPRRTRTANHRRTKQ